MGKWDSGIQTDDDALFAYGHHTDNPVVRRKNYGGYCNSFACVEKIIGDRSSNPNYKYMVYNDVRVLKTTDKQYKSCPDCGHALFWDEISEEITPKKTRTKKLR
ncbi:MAG TPA: hypothetical protein VIG33_14750 [Pseudobdellovibrionaceae bacterium]|jgi:hypothetical protein